MRPFFSSSQGIIELLLEAVRREEVGTSVSALRENEGCARIDAHHEPLNRVLIGFADGLDTEPR